MDIYMLFLNVCLALSCNMVINDSVLTGTYYSSMEECNLALPAILEDYRKKNHNPRMHYYAECSNKILNLKDAGMEI